jgi:hypothetical protein
MAWDTSSVDVDEQVKDELGPFTTGIGGSLAVAGSILPWAVVTFRREALGVEPPSLFTPVRHVMGTHTGDGKITLAIGLVVALLGIAGLLVRGRNSRTAVAMASGIGGVALVAFGISELFRIGDHSTAFNPLGPPGPFGGILFRRFVHVSPSYGLNLLIAGGAIALLGSALVLRRLRLLRRARSPKHAMMRAFET